MNFWDAVLAAAVGYFVFTVIKHIDNKTEEDLARIENYANYDWDKH